MSESYAGFRIESLWAFTVVGDDDEEGIIGIRGPNNTTLPMICSDRVRLAEYRALAESYAIDLQMPVRLSKFSVREDVEVFGP